MLLIWIPPATNCMLAIYIFTSFNSNLYLLP
uniref:Uncharacterized protein n=1 Tax=Rhizophora mucronata TaxID=61149 RepID=A0A2P2N969_RHIMU